MCRRIIPEQAKINARKIFYMWSNIDGEVCTYPSWSELLDEENWEYLSDNEDSLDYFEMGMLIQVSSGEEVEGKVFYEDNHGQFHEYNDGVEECEITTLYYGRILVKCVPSKAEEKAKQIQF